MGLVETAIKLLPGAQNAVYADYAGTSRDTSTELPNISVLVVTLCNLRPLRQNVLNPRWLDRIYHAGVAWASTRKQRPVRAMTVPINDTAVANLREQSVGTPEFVFTYRGKNIAGGQHKAWCVAPILSRYQWTSAGTIFGIVGHRGWYKVEYPHCFGKRWDRSRVSNGQRYAYSSVDHLFGH